MDIFQKQSLALRHMSEALRLQTEIILEITSGTTAEEGVNLPELPTEPRVFGRKQEEAAS